MASEIQTKKNESEAISKTCPEASQMISESEAGGERVAPFQGGNPANPQAPQSNPQAEQKNEVGVKTTSRRKTVLTALAALLFILALATATAVPLYFKYQPSATLISEAKLQLSDGSVYGIMEVSFQDQNILEPSVRETFTVTSAGLPNSRLLQEQEKKVFCLFSENKEAGITIRQCSEKGYEVFIQLEKAIAYAVQNNPQVKRLLLESDNSSQNLSEEEIIQDLSSAFTKGMEIGQKDEFEFDKKDSIVLRYNPDLEQFQNVFQQPKRLLIPYSRQLFLGEIVQAIGNVVKAIVKPLVDVVKKAGPIVGAAVGAVAGLVTGGPIGAISGAQIGYKAGSIAQKIVQNCLPKSNIQINCQSTPNTAVKIPTLVVPVKVVPVPVKVVPVPVKVVPVTVIPVAVKVAPSNTYVGRVVLRK